MDTDLLVSMAASIIIASVKNATKKAKLKSVMLKIYTTISNAYLSDPDFHKIS